MHCMDVRCGSLRRTLQHSLHKAFLQCIDAPFALPTATPALLRPACLHQGKEAARALCRELRFGSFTSLQQQPEMQGDLAVATSSPSLSARRRHRRKSSVAVELPGQGCQGDAAHQEPAAEHQQQQVPGPHRQPAAGRLQQGMVEGGGVPQDPVAEPPVVQQPGFHEHLVAGRLQQGAGEGGAAPQEPAAEPQQQRRPSPRPQPVAGSQAAGAPVAAGGHVEVQMLEQQEGDSLAAEAQGQGQWQAVRTSRVSSAHPRQRGGRAAEYQLAPATTGQPGGLQHAAPSSTGRKLAGVAAASEHQRAVPGGHQAGIEAGAGGQWSQAPVLEQQFGTEWQAAPAAGQPVPPAAPADQQAAPAAGQPAPPAAPADQQADAVQQLAAQRAEGQRLRQQLAAAEAALRREVATATELRGALQVSHCIHRAMLQQAVSSLGRCCACNGHHCQQPPGMVCVSQSLLRILVRPCALQPSLLHCPPQDSLCLRVCPLLSYASLLTAKALTDT